MGRGTNVNSAQFLFDPDEFAYIKKNWFFLLLSAFHRLCRYFLHLERLEGSIIGLTVRAGLRRGFANTQKNLTLRDIQSKLVTPDPADSKYSALKIRFDVVNLFDKIYELRDGSGYLGSAHRNSASVGILRDRGVRFLLPNGLNCDSLHPNASNGSFAFSQKTRFGSGFFACGTAHSNCDSRYGRDDDRRDRGRLDVAFDGVAGRWLAHEHACPRILDHSRGLRFR